MQETWCQNLISAKLSIKNFKNNISNCNISKLFNNTSLHFTICALDQVKSKGAKDFQKVIDPQLLTWVLTSLTRRRYFQKVHSRTLRRPTCRRPDCRSGGLYAGKICWTGTRNERSPSSSFSAGCNRRLTTGITLLCAGNRMRTHRSCDEPIGRCNAFQYVA